MSRKESEENENKLKNQDKVDRGKKKGEFKKGFPSKAVVEARINNIVDSMSLTTSDKNKLKRIFNGADKTPGIIDALFHLDK